MVKLKDIDYLILSELIMNSKISDRKLSKKLGVSQPTVTRRRAGLEQKRLLNYTAIPKFEELGFGILAFSFLQYDAEVQKLAESNQLDKKIEETVKENPSIVFASSGQGLGAQGVSVSIHKDYADYVKFIRATKEAWGEWVSSINSFAVSLNSDNIIKPFTFGQLMKQLK
jgi:DNA-binding Lrp family transcriptional regulator